MITLKEACYVAETDNESMRIIGCYDCDDSYGFVMANRSWKGGSVLSDDFSVGNNVIFVRKSDGKIFFKSIMDAMEKVNSGTKLGIGNFFDRRRSKIHAAIRREIGRSASG
ncbi:MAG: hypothetical protein LUF89_02220 [Ruminococcus sp.]|nr:hypothetical protein [Ruminococcus sp.]